METIDTKSFLTQALLHPDTITFDIIDLIPTINKYYSYLIRKEQYNIPKHFDISVHPDEFKPKGDILINEYKRTNPNLTRDSIYSLLLISSILLEETEVVENILSTFYEENILTYTDSSYCSPILTALDYYNENILDLIKSYIEGYKEYIVKMKSISEEDHENLLTLFIFPSCESFNSLDVYNNYLIYLYTEEALSKIKKHIEEECPPSYHYIIKMTDTKEFLIQALLYPGTITNVSGMLDLIPIIDKYYNYLIEKGGYHDQKHFDLMMYDSDLDELERKGDTFVYDYIFIHIDQYRNCNLNLHSTESSVCSLLLTSSIILNRVYIIENILSMLHEENILTYTDSTFTSPISAALMSNNYYNILKLIESYIQRFSTKIVKIKSISEKGQENLLIALTCPRHTNSSALDCYNKYLIHLYEEEALLQIKRYIDEDSQYE